MYLPGDLKKEYRVESRPKTRGRNRTFLVPAVRLVLSPRQQVDRQNIQNVVSRPLELGLAQSQSPFD